MVFDHVQQQVDRQNPELPDGAYTDVQDTYAEVHLVVHPGFSQLNVGTAAQEDTFFGWLNEVRAPYDPAYNSLQEYESYKSGLQNLLDQTQSPVLILYDEGCLEEYQDFIEDDIRYDPDEVDGFIATEQDCGYIQSSELPLLVETLENLEEGATLRIHGEQNGKCTEDCIESLEQVEQVLDQEFVKQKGETFPSRPLSS